MFLTEHIRRIGNHENRKYKLRTIELELSYILGNPVRQCVIQKRKVYENLSKISNLIQSLLSVKSQFKKDFLNFY